MLAYIGSTFLILAILIYSVVLLTTAHINISKLKCLYIVASTNIILAFLTLIIAFIKLDFTVKTVIFNSSIHTPLIYRIAGTWASHEGSLLLWTTFLSAISIYTLITDNFSFTVQRLVILLQTIIMVSFTIFVYFLFNPLTYYTNTNNIGLDLNPILQDIGLMIHPPILFLSYGFYFIPFIYSITSLLHPDNAKILLNKSILYSKIGLLVLTAGIALGSWWAYHVVGWGGYWFFDPVENISLMVWLAAIIYYHSLLYAHSNKLLLRVAILAAISIFPLTILGTVLVRSDVLTSVHSFALNSSKIYFVLYFLLILFFTSIGIYIIRIHKLTINNNITKYKVKLIILGNVAWFTALLTILISIFYPLIYKLVFGNTISVDYRYFINSFIPVTIPIALLASIIYHNPSSKLRYLRIVTAILISSLFIYYSYCNFSVGSLAIFAATYLIQESIYSLVNKSRYFTLKIPPRTLSSIIGHLGLGTAMLAISLNSNLQYDIDFVGKVGDTVHHNKFIIQLTSINYAKGENYLRQIATFVIENKKQEILILKPEIRYYNIRDVFTQACDIYSGLLYDIHVVLSAVDTDNVVHACIYYRPYMSMIWIGIMLTIIGVCMSLLIVEPNKYKQNNTNNLELM